MQKHLQSVDQNQTGADREAGVLSQPGRGTGTTRRISVRFEPGPSAASAARNALLALRGRVDDALLEDVRLLVSELVTNSVRHSEISTDGLVNLHVSVTSTTLRVEVCDPGKGFEPKPRDADRSRPGGWGLYLVDRLADRWGVARNGFTQVWFEIDHARSPRGAAVHTGV
jgi:anti-sigma regulatory factor (Ser/Thr protein kinase)